VTLIQTVFSADHVVQLSDRRLTRPSGQVFTDEYTKLVCWNQSFSAGFTGLARIDRRQQKSTSEWIAEVLCDYAVFEYGVNVLRTEVEVAIRKLPNNWDKRLAIVVAGFEGGRGPVCAEIANFDTGTGRSDDRNAFKLDFLTAKAGRKTASHTAGALLNPTQKSVLGRYLPRIIGQADGVNRAIRVMVNNQRLVAQGNQTVGLDALCVVIPRVQESGIFMSNLGGPDLPTASASFGFFEPDGFQFRQYGPLLANGGFVQDELIGTADPANPDNQSIGFRFVKVPPSWSQKDQSGSP
jgi:hypothetical protein